MCHKLVEGEEVYGAVVAMAGMTTEGQKEWEDKRKEMIERSTKEYMKGLENISQEHLQLDYVTPEVNNFGKWVNYIQLQPILIEELTNENVVSVRGGYGYSFAITEDGKLFSWGVNDKRQLGLGHRCNEGHPQLVKSLHNAGVKVVDLACGSQHVIVLSSTGRLYSFGLGVFGQLGHGELFNETFPKLIQSVSDINIIQIACGSHHSLALSDEGDVYSWGSAEYGQQAGQNQFTDWLAGAQHTHGERKYFFAVPRKIEGAFNGEKVVKISCGDLFNVALSESGEVYTWGWGVDGALGHGDRNFRHFPEAVAQLRGEKMSDINTTSTGTFALSASGNTLFAYDFQEFVNNPLYSDLQFVFGENEKQKIIHAHKVIVCARSPKLHELILEWDQTHVKKNAGDPTRVVVAGAEFYIFLALLKYLYTDNLIAVSYHVPKLNVLAEKFELQRLSQLCRRHSGLLKEDETVLASTWPSDLKKMVNSTLYSDIRFKMQDDATVYSHRVVLSARSEYFRTIFDGEDSFCSPLIFFSL
eukprot:TRINITY_DN956_c0_g1_i1.p1 TRINITY_DN956_c0_g1~~TRINITY_DN956_c0_g1_i1.p1  ORF type:complete len:529 (-),score=116.20 TRINITY_DN956_c0_g1_i1:17-1603(-)